MEDFQEEKKDENYSLPLNNTSDYDLFSLIEHQGNESHEGHYIAYVRHYIDETK